MATPVIVHRSTSTAFAFPAVSIRPQAVTVGTRTSKGKAKIMDIKTTEKGSRGEYLATVDGHTAEMTYSRTSPTLVIIDHTGVPDALRGKGVGQALAAHAIDEARKGGWKIIPLCPFFKAQTLRHADWADVIQG
ncbi:Acetyltransferase [Agrobacterium tumefaciens]|nr:Acetyltransferase [Agrobacterium tumefaciens]